MEELGIVVSIVMRDPDRNLLLQEQVLTLFCRKVL
jgi:hypothetical protein